MKFPALFSTLALGALLGATVSLRADLDNPAPKPPKAIPCDGGEGPVVGCIQYTVQLKGTNVIPGMDNLKLKFMKTAPSPELFSPEILFVQGGALERILSDTVMNDVRRFCFYDANGNLVQYDFPKYSAVGRPTGKDSMSQVYAYSLDVNGREVFCAKDPEPRPGLPPPDKGNNNTGNHIINSGSSEFSEINPAPAPVVGHSSDEFKNPAAVYLELRYGDGSTMRYSIEDRRAISYRSATGQIVDFATLPELIKPDIIYKDGAIRQVRQPAVL